MQSMFSFSKAEVPVQYFVGEGKSNEADSAPRIAVVDANSRDFEEEMECPFKNSTND